MTIREFGNEIFSVIQEHLAPGRVAFRGSFASGQMDEYSDVDLQAEVDRELDKDFYDGLIRRLRGRFGNLSVRYDPEYKDDRMAQDLRVAFYDHPIFWRMEIVVKSVRDCREKWPNPFPDWSVPNSAFWNVVGALKYGYRGRPETADHYMACACDKLLRFQLKYSEEAVKALLSELSEIEETDKRLIGNLRLSGSKELFP